MRKRAYFLLSTCSLITLFANPENGIVIEGNAAFDRGSSELVVRASDRAIIHWDSFSIDVREITRFIQGSSDAAVLNRVTGDQMSRLNGSLIADGKVFLINPNGVIVGKMGVIDAGSFIASSFDIPDAAFISGEDFVLEGTSLKPIINEGALKAKSGDILLLASRIENKGRIAAPEGDVWLGAGQKILVGVQGKKSLYVEIPGDGIINEGKMRALRTFLVSNGSPYSLGIQNKGRIDALKIKNEGGEIFLRSQGASLVNTGDLYAPNGTVQIDAENAPFENRGIISANEGSISINAANFMSHGFITGAKQISVSVPGSYTEGNGAILKGDEINISAGVYFSTGQVISKEGLIDIEAEHFLSPPALLYKPSEKTQREMLSSSFSSHAQSLSLASSNLGLESTSDPIIQCPPIGTELIDPHPTPGISSFGDFMLALPSGNVVVTKVHDDFMGLTDAGAVYLFNAETGAWISTIRGMFMGDMIGSGNGTDPGVVLLENGNYVILSPQWQSGGVALMGFGAATFGNGSTGVSGVVNSGNSLVGSHLGDQVSFEGVFPLKNGNYVVCSQNWQNSPNLKAGAATWGDGVNGTVGVVSSANSLVGVQAFSHVGIKAYALTNGHYVVSSPIWEAPFGATQGGAATWGNGTGGTVGPVSATNSLYGDIMNDFISRGGITPLTNGHYVVASPDWFNTGFMSGAGAVTWGNGSGGTVGAVSITNSLIGTTAMDYVGTFVKDLANGHYVTSTYFWTNAGSGFAGAVTWGNGTGGTVGEVSPTNSFVGSAASDFVSFSGNLPSVIPLTNGHYVVSSVSWNGGVGAASWGNGTGGTVGELAVTNSLVGATPNDTVSIGGIVPLTNGNYVVVSQNWQETVGNYTGAVTWGDGSVGTSGFVSAANSLIGTQSESVGSDGAVALTNGHYVVGSSGKNYNNTETNAGAATWCSGTMPTAAVVSPTNSIVGTTMNDFVGRDIVALMTNGNYVVPTSGWQNGIFGSTFGAVTWGNGLGGTVGEVSEANSLVGTMMNDRISDRGVFALANGNYVVASINWENVATGAPGAGAATWGNGLGGTVGPVSEANSLVGTSTNDLVPKSGIVELTSDSYVVISPQWQNGTNANAGAITIANSNTGTFCDGTYGAISLSNSFSAPNAASQISTNVVVTNPTGDNEFVVQFLDYSGQTRVFTLQGFTIPVPPTPFTTPSIPAKGIHDFAIAISEFFGFVGWLSLKDVLAASDIYPPVGTYKGLQLMPPSLVGPDSPPILRVETNPAQ